MALEILDAEKTSVSDEEIRMVAELMIHPEIGKTDIDYRHHSKDLEKMFKRLKDFFMRLREDENQLCLLAKSDGNVVVP